MAEPERKARKARTGDDMGSIQGFRCGQCRGELLANANLNGRLGWTPPVLCCEQTLRPLDPGHVLSAPMISRRIARCPRCGYQVRLIVQPMSPLVCMVCQTDFVMLNENPDRAERRVATAAGGGVIRTASS